MGMVLGITGILGFLCCLIGLIVTAIRKQPKKKFLIGLAACFVLFIIGVSLPSDEMPTASTQTTPSSASSAQNQNKKAVPTAPSKPASSSIADGSITVDYKTLYKDYEDNAISADKKYRDKKLVLTGTIANIDRDIAQSPYITFNVDEYGAKSIKMSFDDDDTVAALKKGQRVTITGACSGMFASVVVTLDDCAIVK